MGGPLGDWCTRESGLGLSNFFFFFSFLFFFSFFFFVPFHFLLFPFPFPFPSFSLFFFSFFFFVPFHFLFFPFPFPFPFPFFLRCGFLLPIPHIQQTSLYTKNKNSPEYGDFNLSWSGPQLLQNLKPIRLFFCTDSFCIHIYPC